MATFRASTAVDMSTPFYFYDAYGASIISTGPNLIVLRDPFGNRQDYLGSFSYGTYDLNWSSSNLTGFRQYTGTTTLSWSIAELSIPGSIYYSYALSGNGEGLASYALRGNDSIYGSSGGDVLLAYAGNDYLDGRAGADTMRGGLGNDTYIVDNSRDAVVEGSNQGTDTVQSSVTYTLGNNVENLVLTGTGAINGTGNGLNNTITGNAKNNNLVGGNGSDNLQGKDGADTLTGVSLSDTTRGKGTIDKLTGGNQNDNFILGNASGVFYSDGVTTSAGRGDYAWITDFRSGDKIQLKGRSSDYRLRNETFNGVAGVGLYRNDGSVASGWDSRDELIGFIQVSGVTLNLGSTTQFTYVA